MIIERKQNKIKNRERGGGYVSLLKTEREGGGSNRICGTIYCSACITKLIPSVVRTRKPSFPCLIFTCTTIQSANRSTGNIPMDQQGLRQHTTHQPMDQ